jgi:ComF family protein
MVDSDFGLCGSCWRETAFIGGTVCESCGVPLPGAADGHRIECDDCMTLPRPWSEGRSALMCEGQARKLVLALKHRDRPEIARPAGRWLAHVARQILLPDTLIVPVPLHWSRLLKRRYNQSALLAKELARELNEEHCLDLLRRRKRTSMLEGKNAEERYLTLKAAIEVNPKHKRKLQNRAIMLVDDVMTSSATLTACTVACQTAGAKDVRVLTLARVAKDH